MTQFQAIWFKPEESKQTKVELSLHSTLIQFQGDGKNIQLPYREIELELGGFEEKQLLIKFNNGQQLLIDDQKFLATLHSLAPLSMKEKITTL